MKKERLPLLFFSAINDKKIFGKIKDVFFVREKKSICLSIHNEVS